MLMVTQHSLCEIVLWLLTLAYLNIEFLKVSNTQNNCLNVSYQRANVCYNIWHPVHL